MTIEFSLRRRATRSHWMAAGWLAAATIILVGTYISLPLLANRTLGVVHAMDVLSGAAAEAKSSHVELYAAGILALSLFAVCFACFLLGRAAFVEIELAARYVALADALCLAGGDLGQFEKIANLLMPGTKYLSVPEIFTTKDLSSVVDILKELRPTK